MKKLLLTPVLCLLVALATGQTITAVTTGSFNAPGTWDLNRVPANGDTLLIPNGKTVMISSNLNLGSTTMFIKVYGVLDFSNSGAKLSVSASSQIYVYPGGSITSTGSPSQRLEIGSNTVFRGNQSAVTGPQFATGTTSGFDPFSTLPVHFISFTYRESNGAVVLDWTTDQELNVARFEIQRSTDASNWRTIGSVAPQGTTNSIARYSFTDRSTSSSVVYYRIKEVDLDGKFMLTEVLKVVPAAAAMPVSVVANGRSIAVKFNETIKGPLSVRVLSVNGSVLQSKQVMDASGQMKFDVMNNVVYIVHITSGNTMQSYKVAAL